MKDNVKVPGGGLGQQIEQDFEAGTDLRKSNTAFGAISQIYPSGDF